MLEGELENSGVETESPTGQESESKVTDEGGSPNPQESKTTETPFHEHPRFQELIAQKNKFESEFQASQRMIQEMQRKLSSFEQASKASQAKEDALHARLKGIDPEFGERFAKVDSSLSTIEEMKAWMQNMERNNLRSQAVSMVNNLHTENKVSKEVQELYNNAIELEVQRNPQIGLQELPNVYRAIHEKYSKVFEGARRQDRASYVEDKQKDASVPSVSKGQSPKPAKAKVEYSKDSGEARQQMVAEILRQARAERSS